MKKQEIKALLNSSQKKIYNIINIYMKSRKNRHNYRKNKKGGFFFTGPKVSSSSECDVNNLSSLSKDTGDGQDPLTKMRNNYQKCCPKDFMGRKNTSPYCKQLDMNFQSQSNYQRDVEGYYGDETDVGKIKQIMSAPVPPMNPIINTASYKKPWYQFWGGKKTRKHKTRKHKKRSHKTRKH